jgi:polyhydroxyalkanoate synthesis regulator phasin
MHALKPNIIKNIQTQENTLNIQIKRRMKNVVTDEKGPAKPAKRASQQPEAKVMELLI